MLKGQINVQVENFNKEMKTIIKNSVEILELKNTVLIMEITLEKRYVTLNEGQQAIGIEP